MTLKDDGTYTCNASDLSILKWGIAKGNGSKIIETAFSQGNKTEVFALSTPSLEFMIKEKHLTVDQLSKWWCEDTGHSRFISFTSGSVMNLVKLKMLNYTKLDTACTKNEFFCNMLLTPDVLYMIEKGDLKFTTLTKLAEAEDSKIFAMLNTDTLYYIKIGRTTYSRFEKMYDKFLYRFEPIIWKYVINAIAAQEWTYEELMTNYGNSGSGCDFQRFVMKQDFEKTEFCAKLGGCNTSSDPDNTHLYHDGWEGS